MERSKVFIASSSRALTLAESLRSDLCTGFSEATVWSERSASQLGKTIIEMLEEAAKEYDFSVIILTQDDVVFREGGEAAKRQARDNCIFEAGLFMGALGRDRCFLVASIMPNEVPVDLTGIIHIRIDEPKELENIKLCKEAIDTASFKIKEAIQERGKRPRADKGTMVFQLISPQEFFNMEKLESEDGRLEEGQVVVSAIQPFEDKYEFAAQVKHNLENGIKYVYFFPRQRRWRPENL
jgi:hypothetical protein